MSTTPPFSWTSGEIHLELVLGVVVVALAYALALARRPPGPPLGARPVWFSAALLAVLLALNGPLHDLSESYLFSAHMVQHLLLTLVAAPLALAGMPGWLVDRGLAPLWARPPLRRILRPLMRPLPQLAVYTVALVIWHLPGPYNRALAAHGWHIVEHAALGLTALLAWWPILSPSALLPSLPYGAQVLYLFVFGMPMTIVAAMITGAETILYPAYAAAPRLFALDALADQRLGGVIMWVPAGVIPLVAFTVVFFRWAAEEEAGESV
jgi:putative membrane protein